MRSTLAVPCAAALIAFAGPAAAAPAKKLIATDGPGFTITLNK
jgi:hypothetical protein